MARTWRWTRRLAALLLFAAGAAVAGLLVALPALVERLAVSELAAVGVTGAALTVRRIGLDGAEITDIRLGPDGAATIARLRVAYGPRDLYARRLDEIEIAGVRLRGRLDAGGATIAGLEGLATMGAGGAGTALPVKRIRIEDLRVALETPLGGLSINADGTVTPSAGGGLDIAATVALAGDPGSVSGTLAMTRAANGRITGRATIAEATLGWPPVAIGGLSGDLSFVVDGGAPQSLTARLAAASVETPEGPISAATLALDYDGRNLNASARGSALGGALDGSFTLVARDLTTPKPRLATDGALTWRDGAALASALPGLDPGVGAVSWSLAGTPPADLAALADTTPRAWLQNLATAGTITVETKGLALAEMATGVGIRGTVGVEISHGVIALDDAGGVTVSGRPTRAIVARLPAAFMPLAPGDVVATIGGDGRSPLLIELRPDGDGWAVRATTGADVRAAGGTRLALDLVGDATLDAAGAVTRFDLQSLDLDLRASPPEAAGLAARLRATVSGTPRDIAGVFDADLGAARLRYQGVRAEAPRLVVGGRLAIAEGKPRLTLDRDGRLDVAALAGAGATTGPLTIAINAGKRPLLAVEGGAIRYALDLALPETTVTLTSDGAPKAVTVALPALALAGTIGGDATVTVSGARVAAPAWSLAADGIDATIALAPGQGPRGAITVARLRQTTADPTLAPLRIAGDIGLDGDTATFSGKVGTADRRVEIVVEARHDLASGRGAAKIALAPLRLASPFLEPADLVPALGGLMLQTRGEIGVKGTVAWTESGHDADIAVLVKDLSTRLGPVTIEKLNTVIRLDRLWPPRTPPGQEIAIGLIDAGLPLTDGVVRLRLDGAGAVVIEHGLWHWAGGTISVADVTVTPGRDDYDIVLEVEGVDLARIAALAEIDGLKASGRLDGRIPVTVRDGVLTIAGGKLTAPPGGSVRYAPSTPPAALRNGGDAVTLMLTALRNFRYDSLAITLDRPADGDAKVGVHIGGANPDLYEGYPLKFNLTLSGKIEDLFTRGLEGYRIPAAIRERLQRFGG